MKKIVDHMKKEDLILVQARLPKSLHEEVRAELDREHKSWTDIFSASCKRFLEELREKRQK